MADRLLLVFTNPVEGQEADFDDWYDNTHVGDILSVPGVVAAQRYDLAPMTIPEGADLPADLPAPTHRNLTVYELDRDPDEVMREFTARAGTDQMRLDESLDLTSVSVTPWTAKGPRRTG
ncbi:hypothetical protein [Mycolicibacterium sp. XJ1819]